LLPGESALLAASRSFSTQSTHAGLAEAIAAGKVKEAENAAAEHHGSFSKDLALNGQ
jgi:DNA-binding FadR family transcriptional regulator